MDSLALDGTSTTNLIIIIGAVVTGVTSIIAAIFAGLASLRAGRSEVSSAAALVSSHDNKDKLTKIENQTNSLSHAITQVAQTDADARKVMAQTAAAAPPAPPVVVVPVPAGTIPPATPPVTITQENGKH